MNAQWSDKENRVDFNMQERAAITVDGKNLLCRYAWRDQDL